jgi:hypothetical protein
VFQRITIRRRTYHVPGPNSLWHHDGQHGSFFKMLSFGVTDFSVSQDLFDGE